MGSRAAAARAPVVAPSPRDENRLLAEDRAIHDWYRFVLSFPPHLVRTYLAKFGAGARSLVLDPFCGTGTTIVECRKLGIPSVGVEAHPMSHFAARVKTDWAPDPDGLLDDVRRVAEAAVAELRAQGLSDAPAGRSARCGRAAGLRTLPPDQARLLLGDSISPLPLHKALVLVDCIRRKSEPAFRDHELLALAKALVASIGNLHFGPEVGVGPPRPDAAVVAPWMSGVMVMADDLRALRGRRRARARVLRADSRRLDGLVAPRSVDAVITSPPYPNEKDYTRTTRLESVILGFINSRAELREVKSELVRSNTRGLYKGDDDDAWVEKNNTVHRIADEIEARRRKMGKTSGFERMYHRVTRLYFGGMARHFAGLREVLRPGAKLAYVVGDQASYLRVMIRTGRLLAGIAESLGYRLVGIDLFRTRLATATRERLREEVVVLEWVG